MTAAAPSGPLLSVMDGISSAEAIAGLIDLLYPDAYSALDMTYGLGRFWGPNPPIRVVGLDLNPGRAPMVCADFTALPFIAKAFDLAVFDPPFLSEMGDQSIMNARFSSFTDPAALEEAVRAGAREARRVARLGCIVKVQDYIHASQAVWMSEWVRDELGAPYDFLMVRRLNKLRSNRWPKQLSVWRNHATYWCWRFDGEKHKRRAGVGQARLIP